MTASVLDTETIAIIALIVYCQYCYIMNIIIVSIMGVARGVVVVVAG